MRRFAAILGAAALLPLFSCSSLEDSAREGGGGDRESRVEALLALRGRGEARAVEVAVGLLEDRDVVIRWTAAKNLLALRAPLYQDFLIDRLPRLSDKGLWLGLEVLGRARADFDPARLLFMADPRYAPKFEVNYGSVRIHQDLRTHAARAMTGCSRKAAAAAVMLRLSRGCPRVDDLAGLIVETDRESAVAHVLRAFQSAVPDQVRDSRRDEFDLPCQIAALCFDDPRVLPIGLRFLGCHHRLRDTLEGTTSREILEAAFRFSEEASRRPGDARVVAQALAWNRSVSPERFDLLLDAVGPEIRHGGMEYLISRLLATDPEGLVGWLNAERAPERMEEAVRAVIGHNLPRAIQDPRLLGILLGVRHEAFRQRIAAVILSGNIEPYVSQATALLRESTEVRLSCRLLREVALKHPELGDVLIDRALRSAKRLPEEFYEIAPLVVRRGSRELVNVCRSLGGESMGLWALAQQPRPEDREVLRKALKEEGEGGHFYAALGLVRLGDSEGLGPYLAEADHVGDHGGSLPPFGEDCHPLEYDSREHRRRAMELVLERFDRASIVKALDKAWGDSPSGFMMELAGALAEPSLRSRLVGVLGRSESPWDRAGAARALGRFPGPDTLRALHEALGDKEPEVRSEALSSLALLEDPDLVSHLAAALPSGRCDSEYAREALLALGTEEVLRAVAARVERGDSPYLEWEAEVLGTLAPDREAALKAVIRLMEHRSDVLPRWIIPCLRRNPSAPSRMIRLASSEDPRVRRNSAACLSAFDAPEGLDALVRLMDDPDIEVGRRAIKSLLSLNSPAGVPKALERVLKGDDLAYDLIDYISRFDHPGRVAALERLIEKEGTQAGLPALVALAEIKGPVEFGEWLRERGRRPGGFRIVHEAAPLICFMTGLQGLGTEEEWEEFWSENWKTFRISPGPRIPFWPDYERHFRVRPAMRPFAGIKIRPFEVLRHWHGQTDEAFRGDPHFLVNDDASWRTLWRRLRLPVPPADFSRQTAIVVLWADPDPYNITSFRTEVLGYARGDEDVVVLVRRWQSDVAACMIHYAGTDWRILLVPKIEGWVRFRVEDDNSWGEE